MQKQALLLSELTAITPLDGRYRAKIQELANYTSEYNLIKTRIEIEVKYLIALSDFKVIRKLTQKEKNFLIDFETKLSLEDAKKVKKIEEETRHDVKAMERVFRKKLEGTSLSDLIEMIHFGLTSEDINNLSYRLILKRATHEVVLPILREIIDELTKRANEYKSIPMLARTHGQAAVPTTVGKELAVFAIRLNDQVKQLEKLNLKGKLNGAVGNYNALSLAYPDIDWIIFSQKFISSLSLLPNLLTIQINLYDDMISYFQNCQRINNILIDFDQDMWRYISDNWLVQKKVRGEIGSSTMPQKINPIDFENSEGNLGMANGIFEFFARKLGISRLQRDLSDSTVIRNIGTALGFSLMGYKSVMSGLSRVEPNLNQIEEDLNSDYSILTEGVQTILRKNRVKDPYSLIATLTRGGHINQKGWKEWINNLPIDKETKMLLEKLTPSSYIGLAEKLVKKVLKEIKL